jgi:hypothetical protein
MIRGGSGKLPYAAEQGMNSAEPGIKVPCSAENRDNARLMRRLAFIFPSFAGEDGRRSRSDGV